jgi:hypothetical protein
MVAEFTATGEITEFVDPVGREARGEKFFYWVGFSFETPLPN